MPSRTDLSQRLSHLPAKGRWRALPLVAASAGNLSLTAGALAGGGEEGRTTGLPQPVPVLPQPASIDGEPATAPTLPQGGVTGGWIAPSSEPHRPRTSAILESGPGAWSQPSSPSGRFRP
jgi:hypothetical protein